MRTSNGTNSPTIIITAAMQWLHFTDFHVGRSTGPLREALTSQVDAVKKFCLSGEPIDAVFLGGDMAFGGTKPEYDAFTKYFLNPLRAIEEVNKAQFFSMPGNHDFCCDDALPLQWEKLRERKEVFFCEDGNGSRARRPLTAAFDAYWEFATVNKLLGPNPVQDVSSLHLTPNFPFDVIVTNTAFFSNKDERSSDPNTPIPLSSLRHHLGRVLKLVSEG